MSKLNKDLRKLILYVLLISIMLVGFAGSAFAFKGSPEMHEQRKMMREKILAELELTTKQKEQMKNHQKIFDAKTKTLRNELMNKMKYFMEEFGKQETDLKEIYKTGEEIKKLRGKLLDIRIESFISMKKILTYEQFKKFRESIREMRKGMGRGMRKGMGGFMGP